MCNRWYRLHCLTSHSSSVTQRLPCAHNSPKSWYIHSLISFPSDHLLNLLLLLLLLLLIIIIIIITKLAHLCCLMIRKYVYCSCWVSILRFLVTPMKTFCFCLVGFIFKFFCRSEFVISSTYVILEILTGWWWWWWWWFTSSIAVGIQLQNRYLICINFDQFFCFGRGGCEPNKTWFPQLLLQILGINPGIRNNILIKFFVSHVRGCEQNRVLMEDAECKRAASNCSSRLNGRRKLWCSCFGCLLCFPHSFPSYHQPRHESWGWNCTLPINQVLNFNLRIIFVWFWSLISYKL